MCRLNDCGHCTCAIAHGKSLVKSASPALCTDVRPQECVCQRARRDGTQQFIAARLLQSQSMRIETPDAALALFDTLPAVAIDEIIGDWRGGGFPTGHALDGVLEHLGWRGKRFDSAECACPLLFARRSGGTLAIDPTRIPFRSALRYADFARSAAAAKLFEIVAPLLATTRP